MMAKILIVEDDTQHLEYLVDTVKFGGHEAFPVKSSELALSLLENQQVDFIMTDISLPGISGFKLIQKLHENNVHIPFIVVTGSIEEDDKKRAIELGALDFFVKPVDPEKILECILK